MATPKYALKDDFLAGSIIAHRNECGHCHSQAICLRVEGVTLPNGVSASQKLIVFEVGGAQGDGTKYFRPITFLGITCGCYAKFHRQMAHIEDRMKKKAK